MTFQIKHWFVDVFQVSVSGYRKSSISGYWETLYKEIIVARI